MLYTNDAIKKRKDKNNKFKKAIITIVYMLLIPMLTYNVSLIVQSIINPNETPSFFGIKMYVIISGSMIPELDIGEVVIVKDVEPNELKEKDIISFRKGQSVVTHRITEIIETEEGKEFRTKGDNNNVEDVEPVKQESIEGKVIKSFPEVGKVVLALKDKTVIIAIVVSYYIYLVHDHSRQRRKAIRKLKREEYENSKKLGE